jgi:hypothetical protein
MITGEQEAGTLIGSDKARQSLNAELHRQPAPESIHRADQGLKARFYAAIARAKRYDAQGNLSGCTRALNAARKSYIP